MIAIIFFCFVWFLWTIDHTLYSVHLLLRIKNYGDNEKLMKRALPGCCRRRFYGIMMTIIIVNPIINFSAIILLKGSQVAYMIIGKYDVYPYVVLLIVIDLISQSMLLHVLRKGFQIMIDRKELGDDGRLTDEAHEKLIPVSKYIVLYGLSMIIMVLLWLSMLYNNYPGVDMYDRDYMIMISGYITFRDITASLAMYLSFEWNHHRYKKWCRCCDNCMMNFCTNRQIRRRLRRQKMEKIRGELLKMDVIEHHIEKDAADENMRGNKFSRNNPSIRNTLNDELLGSDEYQIQMVDMSIKSSRNKPNVPRTLSEHLVESC